MPVRELSDILPEDARMEKLNPLPYIFLEGPVWDAERKLLFFSDPLAHLILSMDEGRNFRVVHEGSGYANGMCLNRARNLAICRMETGSINEIDPDTGKMVCVIAGGYQGKPFHATNDVVADDRGGYYITDPFFTYGPRQQDVEATYYHSPEGETIRVATDSLKPNGLDFTPDKQSLYIDDTGSTKVWKYDICPDGTLKNARVFCNLRPPADTANLPPVQHFGEADGLKVDARGNVYVATFDGIQIFDTAGEYLGCIEMPEKETAANLVFGGVDRKTLYITARTSLYAIRVRIPGC